jgi:hypothetical protein
MNRMNTKIGDVFGVDLENGYRKYFQYIANDLTQLNSDVIRVFKKQYAKKEQIDYHQLLNGEIDFHAHTMINVGVKLNLFHKEGKHEVYPSIKNIIFRGTNDSGSKVGEENILISHNWHIWKINDARFTGVGKLKGEYRNSEIGIVMPPNAIVERIKTGKFSFFYPGFE